MKRNILFLTFSLLFASTFSSAKTDCQLNAPVSAASQSVQKTTYFNMATQVTAINAHYTAGWNNIHAVNDGVTGTGNTLANNQTWASWSGDRPAEGWLTYEWGTAVKICRCNVYFWTDTDDSNAGNGVAMPSSWKIQYADANGNWVDVKLSAGDYPSNRLDVNTVDFEEVTTTKLRLQMSAATDGSTYAAMGVTEWEALSKINGPLLSCSKNSVVLSKKMDMRQATLILRGLNLSDTGVKIKMEKPLAGVTLSKTEMSTEKLATGDTLTVTYDAAQPATALSEISIVNDADSIKIPVMTSDDAASFTEKRGNLVFDPCFYSLDRITTWSTPPTITNLAEYKDVKCGATCVKFAGTSGIELHNNIYLAKGEYKMSGWFNTNGTFGMGVYATNANFSTKESGATANASSVTFNIPNTNGQWKFVECMFTIGNSTIGGAWVNNGGGKTATLAYLDNWQLYPTVYPDSDNQVNSDYPISPVLFTNVSFDDSFWSPRLTQNQEVTIPIALEQCYNTGRVDNFKKAAGLIPGYFNTEYPFDDTDIYKIIEGMSYSVQTHPSATLSAQMDTLIDLIGKAQEKDGYLYTARTAGQPGNLHAWVGAQRWVEDPNLSHELYNCGHLYEAATAHYNATGKRTFLDIAIKNADLLVRDFLEGGLTYEPGHQIVEMGLVKMYRATGNDKYLQLAKYFLDLRGNKGVGRKEYNQTTVPVIYQTEAMGHAVRAAYMYSGMADVAAMKKDKAYLSAIDTIWNNVVDKKYYITGGIGAQSGGEAFGADYELPNATAYNETCAAIANVYWNYRMFLLHGDAKYYDVIERTLYNGVISGIALDGKHFFYPNPLASDGGYTRSEWFGCACCPSNLCRFTASIPGYVYAHVNDSLYVNLYVQSKAKVDMEGDTVTLVQKTQYPWAGHVDVIVNPVSKKNFSLMIRVPGWAQCRPVPGNLYSYVNARKVNTVISVNGKSMDCKIDDKGYVAILRQWSVGDSVSIDFPMDVHRTVANSNVTEDKGKVALERGPIVYCLEWCDNDGDIAEAVVDDNNKISPTELLTDTLNGVVELKINDSDNHTLTAIPYYAWANRGDGKMEVWMTRKVSAVDAIKNAIPSSVDRINDVYTIDGRCVEKNCSNIKQLKKGMYVIFNKKVRIE